MLRTQLGAGVVDENPAHQVRGDPKEVRTVLPVDVSLARPLQVGLADEYMVTRHSLDIWRAAIRCSTS
jgi:hypothetical protein